MRTLWWDTLPENLRLSGAQRAPLDGDARADVAIVGAGYTGLWTAYYLLHARPDLNVVVLEAEVAGFGASGRNGGWCSAYFPASIDAIARISDRAAAMRMIDAMNETVDEVGSVAAAEGMDVHWSKGGSLKIARTRAQLARIEQEIAHERSWGRTDTVLLDAQEAGARIGATDVLGGSYTEHCAAVHPARLVRGLALAVERRGARIHEGTRVVCAEPGRVVTERGVVRAPIIVRATEGYTASLRGHRRTLAPVYSLMIATEPLPEEFWRTAGLRERETFTDARHVIIYGQRTADDRLAFGGRGAPYHFRSRIDPSQDLNERTHREIWHTLVDLFPDLGRHTVTHRWGGPLGVPRDWFASCGLDPSTGLAWAGGYVGDGVGTSNLAGRTLADLITGTRTPLVDLPWVGHRSPRWEPEPLRWVGANAGLRVMDSADAAETRTGRPSARARLFSRMLGG